MPDTEDTESELPPPVWRLAPSDRIARDREAAFAKYLERTARYFDAVEVNGDRPWFSSLEERRELFMRRHVRPASPAGLSCDLSEIRKPEYRTDTTIPAAVLHVQSRKAPPPTNTTPKEYIAA